MRTLRRTAAVAAAGLIAAPLALVASVVAPPAVHAAPPGDDEVIAFEVRGVGNGHGRGLSQWGAFGRALDGQSWQEILAAYYGGTQPGTRTEPHMRVRLTGWDGASTVGVISSEGTARWNDDSTDYSSLYAVETSPDVFSVYGATTGRGCPGAVQLTVPFVDLQAGSDSADVERLQEFLNHFGFGPLTVDGEFGPLTEAAVMEFQVDEGLDDDGLWRLEDAEAAQARLDALPGSVPWVELATDVEGPISFSTPVNQATASPGAVLGLCKSSGAVTHYRGSIDVENIDGVTRVVNDVDVENYLRGVLPKEVPPSWGEAGGGSGMNALRAQSVAARSYGMVQSRYSYAGTCDTSSCQVYGGAATRVSPTTDIFLRVEHQLTDQAIADTAGTVRIWPGTGTPGDEDIVSTEFSASNGPKTAGGVFPSIVDQWDDVDGNPNHRWTRIIDADAIIDRYGLASANGGDDRPRPGLAVRRHLGERGPTRQR